MMHLALAEVAVYMLMANMHMPYYTLLCCLAGNMVDAEDYSTPQPQLQSTAGPLKRYMGPTRVVPKVGLLAAGATQADMGLQASQDMNMKMNGPAMLGKRKSLLGECRQPQSCPLGMCVACRPLHT